MSDRLSAGSFEPWSGGLVTANAFCVVAPNPGPMTLDGTNTWVVSAPGADTALVIDPGPADAVHLNAIERHVAARGATIVNVLLTHRHRDHSSGAAELAGRVGCGVLAADPLGIDREGIIEPGAVIAVDGVEVEAVATPGHSSDSVSFLIRPDAALATGDTVLGRGTSVIAHPDGKLSDYLDSLRRLRSLADSAPLRCILPGHGPAVADVAGLLDEYLDHRAQRLAQITSALDAMAVPTEELVAIASDPTAFGELAQRVVAAVYSDVPRQVWPAARASAMAQLEYLTLESDG